MALGLQVWDSSGLLILSVTERLSRLHQVVSWTVTPGQQTTYSVPGHDPNDSSWFIWTPEVMFVNFQPVAGGVVVWNRTTTTTYSGEFRVLRS